MKVLVFSTEAEAQRLVAALNKCRAPLDTEELQTNIRRTSSVDRDTGEIVYTIQYDTITVPAKTWCEVIPLRSGFYGVIWDRRLSIFVGTRITINAVEVIIPDGEISSIIVGDADIIFR